MPDQTVTLNFAGAPEPERSMMSARQAMRETVERAQLGDLEGASLWVRIAAELRQGEWMTASVQGVQLALPDEDDPADRILDYSRGQQDPPSERTAQYARARRRAMEAGVRPHLVQERTLIDEILQRADGDTQVMQAPIPRTMAEPFPVIEDEVRPEGCQHCVIGIRWTEGMGYFHDVKGYIVACPMDMAYRR
jgi:hypothetical protein